MNKAHRFSNNWHNLPVEYALSNIKYLQENYKNYSITVFSESHIKLGEDIVITSNTYEGKTLYIINGLYSPELDKELKYLCDLCTGAASPTAKISHWCENNVRGFVQAMGYTAAVAAVVGLGFGVHSGIKKVKQNKEQYIQTGRGSIKTRSCDLHLQIRTVQGCGCKITRKRR